MIESCNIKGGTLEYIDESHTYIYNGVILPSVTQCLKKRFGGKYDGIPAEIMKRASERGTRVHKAIEEYCKKNLENYGVEEFRNYKFLEKHYKFKAVESELPVVLFKNGVPVCAGRLDLILKIKNEYAVADVKTTSTLDKNYLAYQLNIYRVALTQCYNWNITKLYGLHIRTDKRKLVEIPINEELINEIIERI